MGGPLLMACRTLDAYTVEGAGDRGRSPTDRRSFGPGARTELHAGRPEALATPQHGPASHVGVKRRRILFPPPPSPSWGEGRAAAEKGCSGGAQGGDSETA